MNMTRPQMIEYYQGVRERELQQAKRAKAIASELDSRIGKYDTAVDIAFREERQRWLRAESDHIKKAEEWAEVLKDIESIPEHAFA